jgi:hypothetical protein
MDELRLRLERLVQEGSASTTVPSASEVRRHARRRRRRQATGALLGGALLAAVALSPGRDLVRWLQDTAASAPATETGTPQPTASPPPGAQRISEELIRNEGRPVSPLVVAAQGIFQGTRWEYLAYRTDRGKVCSTLNNPAYTQHLQRLGARGLWQLDGHRFILSSNCRVSLGGWGTSWGLGGFTPDHQTAIMFDAHLPATTASVRFEIAGRPPLLLRPVGRKVLNRSIIVLVLPDLSKVRAMVEYDERGRVLHRWRARYSTATGLDFQPDRGAADPSAPAANAP